MKKKELNKSEEEAVEYILKKGVDIFYNNIRVNEETLTNEIAKEMISKGLHKYFKKWKQ